MAAHDALPLQRGIYVVKSAPCDGASNAETLSYWGGRNGINDQQDYCTITSQWVKGSHHVLIRSCRNTRFDSPAYRSKLAIKVRGRSAFTVEGKSSFVSEGLTYRFCRPLPTSLRK
jgi:hypothetical protein